MRRAAHSPLTRGAFWASIAFYALVALEFFYMVSPFAAYLYGVYGPGLDALSLSESTGWLVSFFMPHIARESRSLPIAWHEPIGAALLLVGLAGFSVGATQIYWSKLTRRRAIVGGMYRWLRHPQYLALMLASFGMLLIWPRYLVLFGFVTVCFAYYLLARLEEGICARQFPDYAAFAARTGMFLPRAMEQPFTRLPRPAARAWRVATGIALYVLVMLVALGGARGIHTYAVDSAYVHATRTEAYLSLGRLHPDTIAALARIATAHRDVRAALDRYSTPGSRFINYVMPAELFVSEVPMYLPAGRTMGHRSPRRQDQRRYKIIFTRAYFGAAAPADGRAILGHAINKSPVIEVWLDRRTSVVERVIAPQRTERYAGIPVPVF